MRRQMQGQLQKQSLQMLMQLQLQMLVQMQMQKQMLTRQSKAARHCSCAADHFQPDLLSMQIIADTPRQKSLLSGA